MKNIDLVTSVLLFLKKIQVVDVVICAGARNAPFVQALERSDFHCISYFEERSAAFYALGKIKGSGQAVAIVTTSGTAVAELLPAVIEAYYQGLPLIVISADRPKSYRGTGAPQSIEQRNIFACYVHTSYDLDVFTAWPKNWVFHRQKPLHINVCFNEPLVDGEFQRESLSSEKLSQIVVQEEFCFQNVKNQESTGDLVKELDSLIANENLKLAILGPLKQENQRVVKNFLLQNHMIHYAETLSGLKNDADLLPLQIQSSDVFVKKLAQLNSQLQVLRIGGAPTLRFWRDLEFEFKSTPVSSFTELPLTGLSRPSKIYPLEVLQQISESRRSQKISSELRNHSSMDQEIDLSTDRQWFAQKLQLLIKHESSEQNYTYALSKVIAQDPVYIGNSLPIRLWDHFSQSTSSTTYGNRGANGIDGQISTYLGWSETLPNSWCVIGDLTALYDLAALGLAQKTTEQKRKIVVMNNGGGQIFSRLFGNKKYLNRQNVDFQHWALLWKWDYFLVQTPQELQTLKTTTADLSRCLIEIRPDNEQTDLFWQEWDQVCR